MSFTPKVYFISTQYLRENTPIEDNVDDDKIVPFIIQAQDTYLQEGIGETFYNREPLWWLHILLNYLIYLTNARRF
jgi:hypothetical protein